MPQTWTLQTFLVLCLLVIVILSGLPFVPTLMRQGRDSGIFAYVGKTILDGGVPYVDAWDNKTPMVYYINALAFSLFGINLWALWLIQMVYVFLTSIIFFYLVRRVFQNRFIAFISTLIFLFQARSPILIAEGNFTETYALLPQVICLLLGYSFLHKPSNYLAYFMGLAASVAFLTKQNTISVAVMFIPAILLTSNTLQHSPRKLRWVAAMMGGAAAGLGAAAIYLGIHSALPEALYATFIAPSTFHTWVSGGPVSVWHTIETTLKSKPVWITMGPLAPFAIYGGIIVARAGLLRDRASGPQAANITFGLWIVLTYLLDMVMANLSNRGSTFGYAHYFLTPMPAYVLLVTFGAYRVFNKISEPPLRSRLKMGILFYITIAVFWWFVPTSLIMLTLSEGELLGPVMVHPLANYVTRHTKPNDFVLVWGASSMINFQTSRRSPTRFYYAYPLIVPSEESEENIDEFIDDLNTNRPALIVDTTMHDGDRVPPLDAQARLKWWARGGRRDVENLNRVFNWVGQYCHVVYNLKEYRIYRCEYSSQTVAGPDRPY